MPGTALQEPEDGWGVMDDIHRMAYTVATQINELSDHEPLIWYLWNLWGRQDHDVRMDEETTARIMIFLELATEMHDIIENVYGAEYWQQLPNEE